MCHLFVFSHVLFCAFVLFTSLVLMAVEEFNIFCVKIIITFMLSLFIEMFCGGVSQHLHKSGSVAVHVIVHGLIYVNL